MDPNVKTSQESLVIMNISAKENTWSNQRRKRRQEIRKQQTENTDNTCDKTQLKNDLQDTKDCMTITKDNCAEKKPDSALVAKDKLSEIKDNKREYDSSRTLKRSSDEETSFDDRKRLKCEDSNVSGDLSVMPMNNSKYTPAANVSLSSNKKESNNNSENDCVETCKPSGDGFVTKSKFEPKAEENISNIEQSLLERSENVAIPSSSVPSRKSTSQPDSMETIESCMCDALDGIADTVEEEHKFIVKFSVKVKKNEHKIVLELAFIDGESKETVHQIMQYMKNRLKST